MNSLSDAAIAVLLVEDDAPTLWRLQDALAKAGYQVRAVISILGDEESVISAITVGATGYLLKDAFPTDIAATVRDLVAGHSPISPN
jgi:DNA-binding NarL/FixJ family response regulator